MKHQLPSLYRQGIIKACKLTGEDAAKEATLIESMMRVSHPTLDGLDFVDFNKLARVARQALNQSPKLRKLCEKEAGY